MAVGRGTITWKGSNAATVTTRFKAAAGKTKADVVTLKEALDDFSDCNVRAEAFIDKNYYAVDGAGNVDLKAICSFADADGETHKYVIPGFNGTPLMDYEGEYVDPEDLDTIQTAVETFTGESFTPLRSPVIQTK